MEQTIADGAQGARVTVAAPPQRIVCQGPQGVVISSPQRLRGLGEQRGENDSADSWPGAKDRHVMLLTDLPQWILRRRFELGAEPVQSPVRLLDLLIDQVQARREVADMRAGGFCRARRDEQRCLPQGQQHCRGIEATDAMVLEDARDRLRGHLGSGGAVAGVGTCCQSARNQSSATSSVNSTACG